MPKTPGLCMLVEEEIFQLPNIEFVAVGRSPLTKAVSLFIPVIPQGNVFACLVIGYCSPIYLVLGDRAQVCKTSDIT
jgi:hypothetical protein